MVQYNDIGELPKRFQKFLSNKLEINESLVLAWQPNGKEYQPDQLIPQLMGLFFCFLAYILFWGYGAPPSAFERLSAENINWIVLFFCFWFFLGGLYFILMPFWAWSWARRTLYIFTSKKAVLITARGNIWGFNCEVFIGETLHYSKIEVKKNGNIDIIFRVHRYKENGESYSERVGFFGINNAEAATKELNLLKSKLSLTHHSSGTSNGAP
jgi:hypothetical protein